VALINFQLEWLKLESSYHAGGFSSNCYILPFLQFLASNEMAINGATSVDKLVVKPMASNVLVACLMTHSTNIRNFNQPFFILSVE